MSQQTTENGGKICADNALRPAADETARKENEGRKNPGEKKAKELVQEPRIHQIELEMQNERLREREEELGRAQERYFDLYENAPIGYMISDDSGNILSLNRTLADMLEATKTEIIERGIEGFLTEEDADFYYKHCCETVQSSKTVTTDVHLRPGKEKTIFARVQSRLLNQPISDRRKTIQTAISDLSEAEQLQRQLFDSEMQFRRITETARDAIISIDQRGAVINWNRAAEDMFQYSAPEILGKNVSCIIPQPYREAHELAMQRVGDSEGWQPSDKTLELEGLRKDGTTFPVELSLSHWQMEGKTYFTGILRDISERKEAEQIVRESQNRFALFMDRMPAAVFIKDANSRVLYLNQYLRTHFGAGDSQGADGCGYFSVEVAEKLARDDRKALAEGQLDLVERLKDRRGRERTFRTLKFAIPQAQGQPPLLGGVSWDISEALAASESLARSRRRYREIFASAQEGIWLTDADEHTLEVNERMAEMLGYSVDEMRGRHLFDCMDEQAREEAKGHRERLRQGISEKYDCRFLRRHSSVGSSNSRKS
jgi:PAS domain S-box-containing protein